MRVDNCAILWQIEKTNDLEGGAAVKLEAILAALGGHVWSGRVLVLDMTDSTNTQAKLLAQKSAPDGTVVIADHQTGGRGRQGRSFSSPAGQGVYLTALLRPDCAAQQLGLLTVMAAVSVCDAVETACGVRPGIKWTNDLVLGGKKLGGILTELSVTPDGSVDYVVVGAGVNVNQTAAEFPPELRAVATSIFEQTGKRIDREVLAAEMIRALHHMAQALPGDGVWLDRYRADCITVGKAVRIFRAGEMHTARADGIGDDGSLLVTYDDGTTGAVTAGEVSVRGLLGYV